MKRLFLISAVALTLLSVPYFAPETHIATAEAASSNVAVPTGLYVNGRSFVIVKPTWVRIVINGDMLGEFDFKAQKDPWGNYALSLSNGESITISTNNTLYYNGDTYQKR